MLEARALTFGHAARRPVLRDVSLALAPGEIVGLEGLSGAGKSTLARLIAGYLAPWSGTVLLDGQPLPKRGFHPVQLLFQTAETAVNPRWSVREILAEAAPPDPDILRAFGIRESWLDRHPHELSGGELQRVAVARALDPRVRYLVADEISGMLDPITQAEIWAALVSFARERAVGLLVIAHDPALMRRLAPRRVALRDGRLVTMEEPSRAWPGERESGRMSR